MATTYRDLLNRVLIGLSEEEIGSSETDLTSKYHKLLGLFVNQMKERVEDAHNWRALRSTEQVTVTSGSTNATISNANERSRVVRVFNEYAGEEQALVFDVTDSNNPKRLREMDLAQLIQRRSLDTSSGDDPIYFALDNSSGDVLKIEVWPTPTDNRTIDITLVIPQARLSNTGALDTTISVPAAPIEVGALWYALEERGEELGVNGLFNEKMFDSALAQAVMRDAAEQGEYQLVPV